VRTLGVRGTALKHTHLVRLTLVGLLMLMAARDFAIATSAFWRVSSIVMWVCGVVVFIRVSQEKVSLIA
jgi:hypothetical protein